MYTKFAIATFCFGERYQKQTNRLINEIDKSYFKPTLVVVTDDINFIIDKPFVKKFNISDFNPEYKNYSDSYYDFDFSVKRYSLLAALNLGFTKIILCDTDAVPNPSLFTEEYMIKGFEKNSIQGQVTYNFKDQINTNSELGKRFIEYEKFYNVYFDKDLLNFMPEDCIQFLDIDIPKFYNFLRVWDDCIKYKKTQNLSNIPAGNIDEMCFSALKCGITVGNNSDKCINPLIPIHDKWYDSHFTQSSVDFQEKNKKKTIVTSIYELNYIQDRGGAVYKGFHLMTETIRSIIFEEYNYVIYTDNSTYVKYNMSEVFNYPNVEIKFCELNDVFYRDVLNPIRIRKNEEGQIWDRIYSVENYIEVIYNKLVYLVEVAKEIGGDICWVDAGLFGTSCHNGWRDHLKNNIVHSKNFVDKIFEKIESEDFIALKGNEIAINYELKDNLQNRFGSKIVIVPGGLFGGKKEYIIEYLDNFKTKVIEIINHLNDYTSEQELLYLLLEDKKCKFFDFNDWDDLQRAILKLMDLYDEKTYQTHTFLSKSNINESIEYFSETEILYNSSKENSDTEISHPMCTRDILTKILNVSNWILDNQDLTKNDYMLSNMSSFATLFYFKSGSEHYRLLSYISKLFENETLIDIGTDNGCSAIALAQNNKNKVVTYDIVDRKEPNIINLENIIFKLENVLLNVDNFKNTRFVFLDANQDGVFELKVYELLKNIEFKGLFMIDDIYLNNNMVDFWKSIKNEKYDITIKGHNTGTGIVIFN